MNPLSSHPKNSYCMILLALVLFLVGPVYMSTVAIAETLVTESTQQDRFSSYGFKVSGFTVEQEAIILKTLDAYAEALGSREQFRKLILEFNHGSVRPINFKPDLLGANSYIVLTPTVFSLEKAQNANYATYATSDEEKHAEIIIGHEIGHIVLWAAKARTGTNWAKSYQQQVKRNWQMINDSLAPEQEAVTQLSLRILKSDYYIDLYFDQIETNPETLAHIKTWVEDVLESLRRI